nr:MAG TPA: hypothetical protein [Caudoviricetes sp.]DAW11792.1 MAG TPA: hypothetical protein [Bacteriophage sp.]DAZ34050.1 MAG TPA: hypothetical protein [Caudoviricetes sp.]
MERLNLDKNKSITIDILLKTNIRSRFTNLNYCV